MKKLQAVIFDWAGTCVDYGSFAPVQAFIAAFEAFGVTPTAEEVRAPMGMLKWDHIHTMMQMPRIQNEWERVHGKCWTKQDVDAVYQKSERAILKILPEFAAPKPFVVDVVAQLRARGIRIGSTTGYTDEMMSIVVPQAQKQGYSPDCWFSPNAVNNLGRPYPYMVFKNLQALQVTGVQAAIKVGDTVADIQEGKNAGLLSVGIVEGSSIMGLSEQEYQALTPQQKNEQSARVRKVYQQCGADFVLEDMRQLPALIDTLENT